MASHRDALTPEAALRLEATEEKRVEDDALNIPAFVAAITAFSEQVVTEFDKEQAQVNGEAKSSSVMVSKTVKMTTPRESNVPMVRFGGAATGLTIQVLNKNGSENIPAEEALGAALKAVSREVFGDENKLLGTYPRIERMGGLDIKNCRVYLDNLDGAQTDSTSIQVSGLRYEDILPQSPLMQALQEAVAKGGIPNHSVVLEGTEKGTVSPQPTTTRTP